MTSVVPGSADERRLLTRPWRTGRSIGRTIYAIVGEQPSDDDVCIGMLDTPGLAQQAVDAHNALLGR